MAVTFMKTHTIAPSKPSEKHLMYLSSLDAFYRNVHFNLRVLFYEQIGLSETDEFLSTLRASLAETLVHFYPLAGRLARGSDDKLVIECNDAGVEFTEAKTAASFKELQVAHFDFTPLFAELAPFGQYTHADLPHVPLLAVQVTRFLEGGVALAISHSHIAMDGPSLWQFWVSWAECARNKPLSKPPCHDRTIFKRDVISHDIAKLIPVEMKSVNISSSHSGGQLVNKVMHFSAEAMRKLKELGIDAQKRPEGPKRSASSLEALFAHCWRHVTQARMLPDEEELTFIVLADMRRVRPDANFVSCVPENFFGNAITWTCASATPIMLREETFAATLARITQTVDNCVDPNNLEGMIHWLELFDKQDECQWFPGVTMNVASSPRFPTHLVDFGWGPPTCARPIRAGGEGEICLFPCSSSALDVCIKLDALSFQRLSEDPTFLCP